MLRYTLKRLLALVPLMVLIALGAFALTYVTPGDAAVTVAGENASVERIAEVRHQLGLDRSLLAQFWHWVSGVVRGDLGTSIVNRIPVSRLIGDRISPTLSLILGGMVVATLVGVPAGLLAGMRPHTITDRLVTTAATLGIAVPSFWLATLLIEAFAIDRRLLPAVGYVGPTSSLGEWLRHLVLPSVAIGAASAAEVARQTRSAVADVARLDFVRTSRSLGLSGGRVMGVHVLKNASIPVLTSLGLQVSRLITATVVVELMFAIPGIGGLTVNAVTSRDIPIVQGVVLTTAVLVLLTNLVVDVGYALVNPKLRAAT